MPPTPSPEAQRLVAALQERGATVASAESLTAGLFAAAIADVPGASAVLRGGLIVYATDLKASLAGVPQALLDRCGPVHPETAVALADGARMRCEADWGVGLTGVAGPAEQDGIAVGTVYLGLSGPSGATVRMLRLDGDRAAVRAGAVTAALRELAVRVNAANS
ncbi:CinA domain protein OS=Tsukamurella paurometabola (strain ATCC 8368 / DSM / CCUG 35730 / CIP 100753 / JCM 10117 / KCTC 9821 / NBRC 16120 / NCIMB 702349/ NCTC 13040) OX=521096 GN=Tpau_1776 PE=4 SV=1 [Tsukamurella paurometabola]|uniref:CinA domain protein n=1 Tax=Tsukamurella paurometabola (strain ATCC 8368 / DSM 20162 / CCUG 35730 / CIP 100753 / JCM 10117 / KCTC 9821 / NBRC 16120 / NCIMB 702349 / NCTC 13040) TaxID=521096 RepID=D5UMB4_TSUPD|nr:CinA domain protein [Tsukamurella paurometabola DSM 20162]SUP31471.1 competence damage-inducible protein A [Tsukamurella paurometabola]